MVALLTLLLSFIPGTPFTEFLTRLARTPVADRPVAVHRFLEGRTTPIIEADTLVHFVYYGSGSRVMINGDLQRGWAKPDTMTALPCGDDTLFFLTCSVPPDTRVDYQFIVDGLSITDPRNPRITPSGFGPHSELAMPRFVSSPWLREQPVTARGSFDTLRWVTRDSTIRPRTIVVYRPGGYETLDDLASLYVHDGLEANDFGKMSTVLDNLIAEKRITPILVVFVPPVERDDEYVWEKYRQFREALSDDLVPFIDSRYRTSRDPQKRGMMGISNGGHISLATVLRRSDVFRKVAGQSSSITMQLLEATDAGLRNGLPAGLRVYVDVGVYDLAGQGDPRYTFLTTNRMYAEELRVRGVPMRYREMHDGHEWANWRERTAEILEYFFGTTP